jgi:ATP-dependent protease HslVU (ClpYQ) peptidase subunit
VTTIAWDGETLAADTLLTWGAARDGRMAKIEKRGPVLAAVSGGVAASQRFLDWFRAGMQGDPPMMPDGDHTTFGWLIFDRWLITWGPLGWERTPQEKSAMGTGANFAVGAMAMGADARRAVEVAMEHDTKTGGDIMVLRR